MRKFKNELSELTKTVDAEGNEEKMSTIDLMNYCLDMTPQGGWDPQTMRERLSVQSYLEDHEIGDEVIIEEAHYEVIKACVATSKWMGKHKSVIEFVDAVNDMKEAKLKKAK